MTPEDSINASDTFDSFSDIFLTYFLLIYKYSIIPLDVLLPYRSRHSVDLRESRRRESTVR